MEKGNDVQHKKINSKPGYTLIFQRYIWLLFEKVSNSGYNIL